MDDELRSRTVSVTPTVADHGRLKYKLRLLNDTGVDWTEVRVDFRLPAGVIGIDATGGPTVEQARLLWKLERAAPKDTLKVTLVLELEAAAAAVWLTRPLEFLVEYRVPVTAPPVLRLALSVPDIVAVGEPFPLNVRATNLGDGDAVDRVVFVERIADDGDFLAFEGPLPTVPPGRTRAVRADVTADRLGTVAWRVTATGGAGEPAVQVCEVQAVLPAVELKLHVDELQIIGDTATIRIVVANTGAVVIVGAKVQLFLPDLIADISIAGGGTIEAASQTVTWELEIIPVAGAWHSTVAARCALPGEDVIRTKISRATGVNHEASANVTVVFGPATAVSTAGPYLELADGERRYAVPVSAIRERRSATAVRPLPGAIEGRGVVRIDGKLLPVFDLSPRADDGETQLIMIRGHDGSIRGAIRADVVAERPEINNLAVLQVDRIFDPS